jgi:Domain of unknown function (DU1801)
MADRKTKPTAIAPRDFLAAVQPAVRRDDGLALLDFMERVSGEPAAMWGPSIVGFGSYHYKYDSGREGDMCRVGFSPRKAELVLYVQDGFPAHAGLLARLGKHRTGVSCLYIKKLADVDLAVLEELISTSLTFMDVKYPR